MDMEKLFNKFMEEAFCPSVLDPGIPRIFTRKRLEVLKLINEEEPNSIRDLARIADRDIKNVFKDLKLLKEQELIKFKKEGRRKRPTLKHKYIVLSFSKKVEEDGRR